jgi:two-component system phosphate regulon response regulator PhoB
MAAKERLLVVDDEEDILELVRYNLSKEGYDVTCAASGETALQQARRDLPDLILLDLMLPGVGGLDVCKLLKGDERTARVPIVMLTAKSEESDVVLGLEMGADDYITKPFSPRVVSARVRAVLRRKRAEPVTAEQTIRVRDLILHPGRREVLVKGAPVELTFTEFSVLHTLARRPGWVFTRSQIVDAVRGDDDPVTDRSVDVQIVSLRKKLGPCAGYIDTVRGVGYRLKE